MPQAINLAAQLAQANTRKLVRKRELLSMLPFSAATLHRMTRAGTFVTPIKLGPRMTAYDVREVNEWLARRAAR
jgi:prophage regulatory protein